MGAIAQAIFGSHNADQTAKANAKYAQKVEVDPSIKAASDYVLDRATTLSNRQYQPFQGTRVAPLSVNERQAGRLATQYGDALSANIRNGGAPTNTQLNAFYNPYLDKVLTNQRRVIGEEYGRQGATIAKNESAMNAFRSGRSDLARSRLEKNRMQALSDAEATGQAGAFDRAVSGYFAGQQAQRGAFDSAQQALGSTGLQARSVGQAGLDADYSEFLQRRDWDVNNLGPLLNAISAARGNSTTTGEKFDANNKDYWGAAAGLIASGISAYGNYKAGQNNNNTAALNSSITNANNTPNGAFDT